MKKSIIPTPAKYPAEKNTSFTTSIPPSLMRKIYFLLLLFVPQVLSGQIITTIAGGGSGGDGGPATNSSLYDPSFLAIDHADNIYFSEVIGYFIRKVDRYGIITTVAGIGSSGYSGDGGQATNAAVANPYCIAIDTSNNVYFADNINNRIRKIDVTTGIITTVVGTGDNGFGGDGGPATAAKLNYPSGICFDKSHNMYIADGQNNRIRKVNTDGVISTIAGTGLLGATGDGGSASSAAIAATIITSDNYGNLYFGGAPNSDGFTIRKINSSGTISTLAGTTTGTLFNGDDIPATTANMVSNGIAIGPDNLLYLSDQVNDIIRKVDSKGIIHTIAGTGIAGHTGDGGLADTAEMDQPAGLTFDSCGNIVFCQIYGGYLRKITYPHCGYLSTREIKQTNTTISIYPNPVIDELHVSSPSPMHFVAVFNLLGQQVAFSNCNSEKEINVPMTGLPGGVYIVRVDGIYAKRVVKDLP